MLRRIDTLYKAKPTLAELYAEDATLFSGMTLPTDAEHGQTVNNFAAIAIVELGELQTIFSIAAELKAYLAIWSALHNPNWLRMQDALNSAYNPIHNYDRTEEERETVTSSSESEASGSSAESGEEDRQSYLAGFNSGPADVSINPTTREHTEPGRKTDTLSSGTASDETGRERELHVSGNIGVTTSQMMVTAEVELRDKYTLYYLILDEFRREICVEVY